MSNAADMSTPVTRGELREEIAACEHRLREQIAATDRGLRELIATSEHGLRELIKATTKQLQQDLAMHAGVLFESMSALITAHDDKYADLPGRVKRLEGKVFGPESR